jgi:hypothetical protein
MRTTLRLLATFSFLAAGTLARPARADITHFQDGRVCAGLNLGCSGNGPVPLEQGETRVINVKGQNVNFCSGASVAGSNVTVAIAGTKLIADGASAGTGQIDLRFTLGDGAAPGNRNVSLTGCFGANFTLVIDILRNGTATAIAAIPRQSDAFTTVDLTISGTNIANAGARVIAGASLPTATAQAQVLTSTATSATVRLTFSTGLAMAQGQIFLFDNSFPNACMPGIAARTFGCYGSALAYSIEGPNVVESISFPTGNRITPGSVLTIRLRLLRPAPTGTLAIGTVTGVRQTGTTSTLGGELVKWQVHPAANFAAEPGTTFSPTVELNEIRIAAGAQQADLVVRLISLPAGCNLTCTATVEARTGDFRNSAPFKKTATFTLAFQ